MTTAKPSRCHTVLSAVFAVLLFFLIISFSIGLPIHFRPFYYWQIEPLGLVEETGYSEAQLKDAYREVLNYLTLPGGEFSAGDLPFSENGASHFRDCKFLFTLNTFTFFISGIGVLGLLLLKHKKHISDFGFKGIPACVFSGASAIIVPCIIGAVVASDFDSAFLFFHKIVFPDNTDWIMNPRTDPIVKALPHEFFMGCAILIGAGILILSVTFIAVGLKKYFKHKHSTIDSDKK